MHYTYKWFTTCFIFLLILVIKRISSAFSSVDFTLGDYPTSTNNSIATVSLQARLPKCRITFLNLFDLVQLLKYLPKTCIDHLLL
ncbi:hypothetical protein CKL83_27670 [Bacillus anthracis]|uniref:Uncharacterized protein n=1 Tax=Bacillus cereus (strain 03BB102) TaxID=572264 RepID=A0A125YA26_BACC3|nr:hypothetical protein BCA_A0185 [Bacillus cereus 03BB102]ACQ50970.1 hypothetical protein BAA_A0202 [Bacillus anthracis str. A0248]APT29245.1 hypothetical protein BVB96_29900 [Bacillus anthracis]ARO21685.1 hypothetical protein B2J90_30260 [Bacillus cereus]EDR85362.1 hypothetical protein BAQ_A0144 [Bacillus anthracis str. A0193]EDR90557.1 hypothetical protein BAH_A0161 [Bacillus anthracis str. A0442]EDS94365.1 hypothetical protein BAK_A0102 [Bacillus anthracis str. A0389]EDT17001.1 hypotheti